MRYRPCLAVVALVRLSLERLDEATEGIFFKHEDIVKDAFAPVGRNRLKLFCGRGVNVDGPAHDEVGRE